MSIPLKFIKKNPNFFISGSVRSSYPKKTNTKLPQRKETKFDFYSPETRYVSHADIQRQPSMYEI